MLLATSVIQEEASGFDHDVHAHFVPLQVGRVTFGGQADVLAIHHQVIAFHGDVAVEVTVYGVVLQHVGQIGWFQQVVDGDHFDFREVFGYSTENHATDATKAIDTNTNCHFLLSRLSH